MLRRGEGISSVPGPSRFGTTVSFLFGLIAEALLLELAYFRRKGGDYFGPSAAVALDSKDMEVAGYFRHMSLLTRRDVCSRDRIDVCCCDGTDVCC